MIPEALESRPVIAATAFVSTFGLVALHVVLWTDFAVAVAAREMLGTKTSDAALAYLACVILAPSSWAFLGAWRWAKGESSQRRDASKAAREAAEVARKRAIEHLTSLLEDEKRILRGYLNDKTRSKYFRITNGTVNTLVGIGILQQASEKARGHDMYSFVIEPWAYEHLEQHPELLEATLISP